MFDNWSRDTIRLIVTGFIWAVIGIIAIVSIAIPGDMSSGAVILTALGLIFGYQTTRSIWGTQEDERPGRNLPARAEPIAKRKRNPAETKAEMLLALMDDDERDAFKVALQERLLSAANRLGDDGELAATAEDDMSIEALEELLARTTRKD